MKKLNAFLFLFVALSIPLFFACTTDVEPLDSELIGENPAENPGTNPGTTSGDYWPMAINNTWTYENNGTNEPPMKITSAPQIGGKTYYKYANFIGTTAIQQLAFTGNVWSRKENNTYFLRQDANIPAQNGNPAITVSPAEIQILKDNLAVNETWTHTFTQTTTIGTIPVPSEVIITGKVLEKDSTISINGVTFTQVIKVQVTQNTQGISQSNFYWFAKNIGLIKFQNDLLGTGTNYEIVSYNLN
jgi:hypothetical protein